MGKLYIGNAFSLGMIESDAIIKVRKVGVEEVKKLLDSNDYISCVGHASTSEIVSTLLEKTVPTNRIEIKLGKDDRIIVFQLLTRLREGEILDADQIRKLPHVFYLVEIIE